MNRLQELQLTALAKWAQLPPQPVHSTSSAAKHLILCRPSRQGEGSATQDKWSCMCVVIFLLIMLEFRDRISLLRGSDPFPSLPASWEERCPPPHLATLLHSYVACLLPVLGCLAQVLECFSRGCVLPLFLRTNSNASPECPE